MREHLGFLKASSVVVKVGAWLFLIIGILASVNIFAGVMMPQGPRWSGVVVLAVYVFFFFFLYLIAKIADLLVKIINELKKE